MENSKKINKYFSKLEKFIGSKFPPLIVNILEKCGFDCEIALQEIGFDCIESIEKLLNFKRDLVQGTVYEHQEVIKLLPGHCQIILAIPEHIKKLKQSSKQKNPSIHKPKFTFEEVEIDDTIDAEVVTLDENSVKSLTSEIVSKLENAAKIIKLVVEINDRCIIDLCYTSENKIKCMFICPICQKAYSCIYKNHWKASNAQAHLKIHVNKDANEDDINRIIESANSSINKTNSV